MTAAEWTALWLSVKVAAASVLLVALPGVAVAWLLARKRFPGKTLLDAVVHLPLVLPPVVVGYLLLVTLGRGSPVGRFLEDRLGLEIAFTWKGAAVASAVTFFSYNFPKSLCKLTASDPLPQPCCQVVTSSNFVPIRATV